MKKKIILIICLVLVLAIGLFVLIGCGNKKEENKVTNNNSQTTQKNESTDNTVVNNTNNTTTPPCVVLVDVNGDKKPYPANINASSPRQNLLTTIKPDSNKVKDTFTILITEDRAIPYGVLAQKAMYDSQK